MKNLTSVPAKAVSDLLVWDVAIGVWSDFIALLSDLLGFLGDLLGFFAPAE